MSNNIDDKKVKVKKRKKEEMSIEDFCKKNNIKLKIDISYEESPEKEIPNKKIKNKNNFQKSLKWRGKKTMGRRKKVSWRKEKKMGDAM